MGLFEDDSILMSIKKLLNIDYKDTAFDTDIKFLINNEFMTLQQLGIGPEAGFSVEDVGTEWEEFSTDNTLVKTVKAYIYLRVRMLFDPPASSVVADAINSRINELEWRLNVQAERDYNKTGGSDGT